MDHTEYLGPTLADIAGEKAGIFKSGCPAIIAAQDYDIADSVLVEKAEAIGATPLMVGGQDFSVHGENGRLIYQDEDGLLDLPLPRLGGQHQWRNAGTAIAALRACRLSGLEPQAYEKGMENVDWPGRFQRLARGRLADLMPKDSELWLDGGHNPDGARVLAATLGDLEEKNAAPLVLICGMLGTKDAVGFFTAFQGLAREVIAVPIPGQIAARPAEEVAVLAAKAGLVSSTAPNVEAALASLSDTIWERAPRVLICGSLYLAGEVLSANGTLPI
jgi:dihydrofolate synthase/folylpolyglutamate synthase